MAVNFPLLDDPSFRFLREPLENSEFGLSFLHGRFASEDLLSWRDEARAFIAQQLLVEQTSVPPNVEFDEEEDFGDYVRRRLSFDSAPGIRVSAYLLVPKGLTAPAPAVVVLHDHGGMQYWGKEKVVEHREPHPVLARFIDGAYGGRPPASELAKRGYVTLVADNLFFGERRFRIEELAEFHGELGVFEPESEAYIRAYNEIQFNRIEAELAKAISYSGGTAAGICLRDDRAAVSVLSAMPEVDPQRIGCIGLSMGGHRSGWLGALDDRIKCAVVVCWMARHREMVARRIANIHWMWNVPGLYRAMDYPDVVSLCAPKPLMVIHGKRDTLFPERTGERAIELVAGVYVKAGVPERFTPALYDSVHEFNAAMQADAYAWLDDRL
ncbi:alpha/beta hydrolase [Cohnella cellulosilytica]|uniref:Alpha/beta hydrolase n=1 Tax=Cohnella cellulosilytica TaxID=986710 RepID=A0ABW2F5S6_9BACL